MTASPAPPTETLQALFAALPVALVVFDADHRLVLTNDAPFAWQGLDPRLAPPGTPFADIVRILAWAGGYGPGDPEALSRAVLSVDRSRATSRLLRISGDRTVLLESRPLPDGGFFTCAADVTTLVRAEAEASGRARQLESVLSRLHGGVALFDPEMRLSLSNPAYETLIGLPTASIRPGHTHREVIELLASRGEIAADEGALISARMEGGRHRAATRLRQRPGGEVLRFETQPMPDGGCLIEVDDITALKRAEDDARRRAAMLDAVLAALPHGVCVFGPDRRVSLFNDAHARIMHGSAVQLGETLEDLVARRVAEGEFTPAQAQAVLDRQFARDGVDGRPVLHQRPNGTVIEARTARLPDGGHISVITDVTALQKAEAESSARAAMLDGILAALPHGVCVYGPDRRVKMFNAAYTRIMQGAPVQVGDLIDDLAARRVAAGEFSAEHAARTLARKFVRSSDGWDEMLRRRPNGSVISIRDAMLPDGGHISVVTDVTAQHRAEDEARQQAATLEAMMGTIRHGIIMYDRDRRVVATNAKTSALTGMPADLLVPGRLMDDLIDEQVMRGQITPDGAVRMKAIDRSVPQRYSRARPDGRVIDIASDPTPDGGYVITYSDVTDDRRIRMELEKSRAAAEAGSLAKSRFLATMSHELRTPLNAVIGFSEALVGERNASRIEDYSRAINEAGRQLLVLIDDILDVARSQSGMLPMARLPVPLAPLLQGAAQAVADSAIQAGLSLAVSVPKGLPDLVGDAARLQQVLMNLLSNAVKFTPQGGRIRLSAALTEAGLQIQVADTGIGIAKEDRDRVFEPFTQVDASLSRRFQGSGLGLYLARTLAEAMGGTLSLEDPAEDAEGAPGIAAVLRFPAACLVAPAPPPDSISA